MELSVCLSKLTTNGYRLTYQRKALIRLFLENSRKMLTAKEVREYITRLAGKQASFGNVYDNLYLLCTFGIIDKTEYCGESFFYRKEMSEKESVMFICTNCRKFIYFSDGLFDEYLKKEEKEHAYRVISKKFEIYGLCPQCRVSG